MFLWSKKCYFHVPSYTYSFFNKCVTVHTVLSNNQHQSTDWTPEHLVFSPMICNVVAVIVVTCRFYLLFPVQQNCVVQQSVDFLSNPGSGI